jgi:hypothetical protein
MKWFDNSSLYPAAQLPCPHAQMGRQQTTVVAANRYK